MWAGCPHPAMALRLPHIIPFSGSPLYFFTACTAKQRLILEQLKLFRSRVVKGGAR